MAVMMLGFAAMMVSIIYRGIKYDRVRNIDDPTARRTVRFEVNVNEADWPEIAQLPAIGPIMAQRLVAYRQTHGPFRSVEEVVMVKGIGEKTLAAIAPYVTVGELAIETNDTSPSIAHRP